MRLKTLGVLAAVVAGVVLSASGIRADTINANYLSGSGTGTLKYTLVLDNDSEFLVGGTNMLVINDFPGVTAASFATDGTVSTLLWGGVASLPLTTAQTNPPINETDNASLANVVVTFTASSGALTLVGPQTLGILTVTTTDLNAVGVSQQDGGYTTWSSDTNIATGLPQQHATETLVPVPVPAAVWTGMSTLLAVGGLGLIRRRRLA